MLLTYRGVHAGREIAVLGSGPSLELFAGQQPIAIAVNGAAMCAVQYQYFVCGDPAAPRRAWFYSSRRYAAARLVASFVAPRDAELFPHPATRLWLRLQRYPRSLAARRQASMLPLYDYLPRATPVAGHAWFQYTRRAFPAAPRACFETLDEGRVLHGASIAGVAVQIAFIFGASAIHLYGCDMDNDAGDNYFRPGSQGQTTPLQRRNFTTLTTWIEQAGVAVVRHRR